MARVSSSSNVGESFASLLEAWLLPLYLAHVCLHQAEALQGWTRTHVIRLDCFRNGGYARLSLTRKPTSLHSDVHIQEASILCDYQREQDPVALGGHEEVLDHWLAVDGYLATASLHIGQGSCSFTLTCSPGTAMGVEFSLSVLPGKCSPEVEEIYPIEPSKVFRVLFMRAKG